MDFRLADSKWDKEIDNSLQIERSHVRIVCPFIKKQTVARILSNGTPNKIQVITRFKLGDFAEGVSDIDALKLLIDHGAEIRGLRNLHAKLYIFGHKRAILTSANLTEAALLRNHEFGFVAGEPGIIARCTDYFENLWTKSGPSLLPDRLAQWKEILGKHLATGGRQKSSTQLPDFGAHDGILTDDIQPSPWVQEAPQGFVKFFGESRSRAAGTMPILEEVHRSGCHWACTYPIGKRPRQVKDGALMFMGRMTTDPNDILIYGRAIGMRYEPDRDDATASDIQMRNWKAKWPHYIRVHHSEFLAGNLHNGVSLNELMDALKSNSFASTRRNAAAGKGNIDPRSAYRQQAAVELTPAAIAWMNSRLERAFLQHGKLEPSTLGSLDWP